MKKLDNCPVTHISLHIKLRELQRSGLLSTQSVYYPGMGAGERYALDGQPVSVLVGHVGELDWLDIDTDSPASVNFPHDIAFVGRKLVAMAPSL